MLHMLIPPPKNDAQMLGRIDLFKRVFTNAIACNKFTKEELAQFQSEINELAQDDLFTRLPKAHQQNVLEFLRNTCNPLSIHVESSMTNDLFRYVKKNKAIPDLLHEIQSNYVMLIQINVLRYAIVNGIYSHLIFAHEHCILMTEILFHQGEISADDRLTVFTYLSVLQTHTNGQQLAQDHQDLKYDLDVSTYTPKQTQYSTLLETYMDNVLSNINGFFRSTGSGHPLKETIPQRFNTPTIKSKICNLPYSQQLFIGIKLPKSLQERAKYVSNLSYLFPNYTTFKDGYRVECVARTLFLGNLPFNPCLVYLQKEAMMLIPSYAIIKTIMNELNPDIHYNLTPVLGAVRPETLYKDFHTRNLHCAAVYLKEVRSSQVHIHGLYTSPANGLLHDIGHYVRTCLLLTDKQLNFINSEILAFVINFINFFKTEHSLQDHFEKHRSLLFNILENYNDLDEKAAVYENLFHTLFIPLVHSQQCNHVNALNLTTKIALASAKQYIYSQYGIKLNLLLGGDECESDFYLLGHKKLSDWSSEALGSLYNELISLNIVEFNQYIDRLKLMDQQKTPPLCPCYKKSLGPNSNIPAQDDDSGLLNRVKMLKL